MARINKAVPIILALALVGALIWGINERRGQAKYRADLENMYERSFYELVDGVGNLEVQVSKLLVTDAQESTLNLLSDIRHKADLAQAQFGMLPVKDAESTSKFINQVGDYCDSLMKKAMQGQPLTDDQRQELGRLRDRLTTLGNQMRDIQAQAVGGQAALWEASFKGDSADGAQVEDPLADIGRTGMDYPSLVYDGPFSDAGDAPPKALSGDWVEYQQAEGLAREFVGQQRVEWVRQAQGVAGEIPTHGIEMMLSRDGVVTLQITQQGGHVLWMIPERMPLEMNYDLNQCYDAALQFMQAKGYPEVTLSYYQAYENLAVFNLIPVQEGVLLYPDLIKLQVSMETGQIIGIEEGNYLRNHVERAFPLDLEAPLDEALLAASRLEVQKTQLALVPKLNEEILCHEITGLFAGETYILYVDAMTGKEVDLMKILDVEGGRLAM